jgi:hypothetical protein
MDEGMVLVYKSKELYDLYVEARKKALAPGATQEEKDKYWDATWTLKDSDLEVRKWHDDHGLNWRGRGVPTKSDRRYALKKTM